MHKTQPLPPYINISQPQTRHQVVNPIRQTLIITQPNYPNVFIKINCPHCGGEIQPTINNLTGPYKWFSYIILFFILCIFGIGIIFMFKMLRSEPFQ